MRVRRPRVTGQVPIHYSHKPTGRPPAAKDHFTSQYIDVPWTPLWPFGHGLSYTTFTYANLRLSTDNLRAVDSLRVSMDVGRFTVVGDTLVLAPPPPRLR